MAKGEACYCVSLLFLGNHMPLVVGIKDEKGLLSGRQIHGYNTAWRIMESQSRQPSRRQYTQSGLQEAELSEQSHEK